MSEAETGMLQRPGAQISFWDAGAREAGRQQTVLLTHGAGMDATTWDAVAPAIIERGFRVITWDLRGHGNSPLDPGARFRVEDALDDIAALLDARGVEQAVLVGHSLGGNLGQRFAREHPNRVKGLIVIGATWNAGPLTRLERVGIASAAPLMHLYPARTLVRAMASASAVTPDAVARTAEVLGRMPKRTFIDVFTATAGLPHPDPAARTPVPLALIRGAQDGTGNIATAMPRWADAEGIAERVIPNAGHMAMWDAPAATITAVADALESFGLAGDRGAD